MKTIYFKLFVIVTIFLQLNLFSQDIPQMRVVGTAEYLPNELIGNNKRDTNGDVCAGIMIISDLVGLTYQSNNGIVDKKSEPGKDLLYVSPSERVIEVYKFGYEPLRIILSDLSIDLKSGQVWQIKITGDNKLNLIPVNIITDPNDAKIIIDGQTQTNSKNYQLAEGLHNLTVEKTGFKSITKSIDVKTTNNFFEVTLKRVDVIMLIIKSIPTDANIYIDNVEEGKTDKAIFKMPGNYSLKISKSGYLDYQKNIAINENSPKELSFTLSQNIGKLSLDITPKVNKIKLNNTSRTISNSRYLSLAPGIYKLEIDEPGYKGITDYINIKLGETTEKAYNLTPITGNLQLSVKPLETKVKLYREGKLIKSFNGPKILYDLLVGEYKLFLSLNDYESISENIMITENSINALDITLKKINKTKPGHSTTNNNYKKSQLRYGDYYVWFDTALKKSTFAGSKIIAKIPQFSQVKILSREKYYYRIKYKNNIGYVLKSQVKRK